MGHHLVHWSKSILFYLLEKKKTKSGAEVNCRLPTAIALPAGL
jgi:hypothetical protein